MWNNESLKKVLNENFKDYLFVIASNREPYIHTYNGKGEIVVNHSIGGVSITLDSIMKAAKGTWVAYGGSMADKKVVDRHDHIKVPPNSSEYTLRRIWMTEKEREGYYDGFSNQALWPLCHTVFKHPTFIDSDWEAYKTINKRFAKAIIEEIKGKKAVIWIHDYQLALVAKYIKEKRPDVIVAHFWHIPWPTHKIFRICPWKKEILEGLLSNDLLGFHRYHHADNFLQSAMKELECKVSYEDLAIVYKNHKTKVGFFPISVDYQEIVDNLEKTSVSEDQKIIKKYVPQPYDILAIGIDRIDYTKGLINRLLAIEKFLDMNPRYKNKFTYLGIGARSRSNIKAYKQLETTIKKEVARINKKFSCKGWQPIYFVNKVVNRDEVLQLCRIADICLVTSLDDGMNLVAKEYIVANKGTGALVLSSFAGAAKELSSAFIINPYDIYETARAIKTAIKTPITERKRRMTEMKEIIKKGNVYRWSGKFLLELAKQKLK